MRNIAQATHTTVDETDNTNTASKIAQQRRVNNADHADHANEANNEIYIARYTNSRRAALARLTAAGRA